MLSNRIVISRSPKETMALGKKIAARLKAGDTIALIGDLGSGKTTFVKGLALGLGNKKAVVSSPSFVMVREYNYGRLPLYHADLYRLGGRSKKYHPRCGVVPNRPSPLEPLESVGLEEYIGGDGVCAIEWAEKAEGLLPKDCIRVSFKHVDENTRRIEIEDTCA